MAINQLMSTGKAAAVVVARCHDDNVRPGRAAPERLPYRRTLPWWRELTTLVRLNRFCHTVV